VLALAQGVHSRDVRDCTGLFAQIDCWYADSERVREDLVSREKRSEFQCVENFIDSLRAKPSMSSRGGAVYAN